MLWTSLPPALSQLQMPGASARHRAKSCRTHATEVDHVPTNDRCAGAAAAVATQCRRAQGAPLGALLQQWRDDTASIASDGGPAPLQTPESLAPRTAHQHGDAAAKFPGLAILLPSCRAPCPLPTRCCQQLPRRAQDPNGGSRRTVAPAGWRLPSAATRNPCPSPARFLGRQTSLGATACARRRRRTRERSADTARACFACVPQPPWTNLSPF